MHDCLADIVEDPEFHRLVLKDYRGAYSLGIIGSAKVLVSVPNSPLSAQVISQNICFKGTEITVEVERNWEMIDKLRVS